MEILFVKLFAILVQWNDLSVLTQSLDRYDSVDPVKPNRRECFWIG